MGFYKDDEELMAYRDELYIGKLMFVPVKVLELSCCHIGVRGDMNMETFIPLSLRIS